MALDLPYNKQKKNEKNNCKLMYREHNNRTPSILSVRLRIVYLAEI